MQTSLLSFVPSVDIAFLASFNSSSPLAAFMATKRPIFLQWNT